MPVEILMPALSPTMTKGKLVKWCKNTGDPVQSGDVIAEVETDKATMEVEAFEDGTIGKLLVEEGQADISVNSVIAVILLEDESEESLKDFVISKPQDTEDLPSDIDSKASHDRKESKREDIGIRASPLAKRLARDKDLDLAQIKGSGPLWSYCKKRHTCQTGRYCTRERSHKTKHTNRKFCGSEQYA